MTPLFSVIIPTYNRANLLAKAIQSVLDQKVEDWELIVVDDGSTDETKAVINNFEDSRIIYVYQKNQKLSAARNTGVKNSTGRYICFLDDDDYYLDNHLEVFYNWLVKNNFPQTILRSAFNFKKSNVIEKGPYYDKNLHRNPVNFAAFHFCGSVSLCIPIQCFNEDDFLPGAEPWEDTHFMLRIFAKYDFHQLPYYTYIYVRHDLMGSIKFHTKQDTLKMAEQNIEAMRNLFYNYGDLVNPFLPAHTESYIISGKYSEHAVTAIILGNYKVVWKLLKLALKNDKRFFHWKNYLKILIFYPLKKITGFPKLK